MNFTTLIILIFTAILAIGSVSKGLTYGTCVKCEIVVLSICSSMKVTPVCVENMKLLSEDLCELNTVRPG